MDSSAAPLIHVGGPPAAAHSFESRDRRRGRSTDMTDATSTQGGETALSRLADLGTMLRRSDIALALGMMTILVILILPLPPILLDFSLAVSITFSVLILMTALFIQAPLEFSAFPTVLLISTMLRLALNLASTRLILGHGHEGHGSRRPRHPGVRQFRDERQFRHRHYRVHDPGDREFRGHHQGLGTHRRSRGTLPPRLHAGQADGDRRRSQCRPHRREGGAAAAQEPGGRIRLLSAPWMAPRNSCAATPSPACSSS